MQKEILQNLVITGANEGIGFQTMKALFLTGKFNIVFGSRNMERNQLAKQNLIQQYNKKHPNTKPPLLQYFKMDLGSKKSIEGFIKSIQKVFTKIHILINNAGALFNQKAITNQLKFQVEKTLMVDYFGVVYLTFLALQSKLIDKKDNQEARIINVSSSAHQYCQNNMFDDLTCSQKMYSTYRQYSIAKFFLTAFSKELAQRLEKYFNSKDSQTKIKVVALHPGVVNTNIGNDVLLARVIKFVSKLWMKTNEDGAKSSIALTLLDFDKLTNGGYYNEKGVQIQPDKRVNDISLRQRLWKLNQNAFGIKFQI